MSVFPTPSSTLISVLAVICRSVATASCTAGLPQPAGEAPVMLPDELFSIPFPDESSLDRSASVEEHHQVPGSAEWKHGPGSYDIIDILGSRHHMPALAGKTCWAIYRFSAGGFPPLEGLFIVDNLGLGYYIGHADFSSGRWSFDQPQDSVLGHCGLDAGSVSPLGFVYMVVVAHDGVTLDVKAVDLVTDEPGWETVTVASGITGAVGVELLPGTQNELPRIALLLEDHLRYYFTNTRTPSATTVWNMSIAMSSVGTGSLRGPLVATFVDWKPATLYYRQDGDFQPEYTYGKEWYPEDAQWASSKVGTAHSVPGQALGLVAIDNMPRVAYPQPVPGSRRIMLASSAVSAPSAADWSDSVIRETAIRPSLAVVNGRLACSYINTDGSARVGYARALVDNPDDPLDWAAMDVYGDFGVAEYGMFTRLVAASYPGDLDAPFILFSSGGLGFPQALSSTQMAPLLPTDWQHSSLDAGSSLVDHKLDLALVSGLQAALYVLDGSGELRYAVTTDFQPDEDTDWDIQTLLNGTDIGVISLGCYMGNPAIAYVDRDAAALKYSYFD
ncbi:hypothetical protein KDL29_10865 [bacterium]|nr:hypothetical protein [bacterium]